MRKKTKNKAKLVTLVCVLALLMSCSLAIMYGKNFAKAAGEEGVELMHVKVTDPAYGAVGDGVTDDRLAIQKAINAVSANGGGTVELDAGKTFLSGNLFLKSNVTLQFGDDAKLKQNPDINAYYEPDENGDLVQYTPLIGHDVRADILWDLCAMYNYPLIYAAEGTENVKIIGKGHIEMFSDVSCGERIHMVAIGFYGVNNYEIADISITDYSSYACSIYSCTNGLVSGISIYDYACHGTDGISTNGCQNLRVTGCYINSGDDSLYVCVDYNDPRGKWFSFNGKPVKNIEFDNNNCTAAGECKAFMMLLWGSAAPDLRDVEVSNMYIHDNFFSSMGIWYANPYDASSNGAPVKNIRFENNTIYDIQSNFYAAPISDMNLYPCMTSIKNGNFEKTGDAWWSSVLNENPASAGAASDDAGQNGEWYGYIDHLDEGDAKLYEGLYFESEYAYRMQLRVKTSGDTVRLFVRDLDTQELIASKEVNNTEWEDVAMNFMVPKDGNYHVGIERGNATEGWAKIDDVFVGNVDETIFTTQVPWGLTDWTEVISAGTKFYVKVDGTITKVRIYGMEGEKGIHDVRIWDVENETVIAGPYEWDVEEVTESGWIEYELPTPLKIEANKDYIVAVSNSPDGYHMPYWQGLFDEPIINGNIVTYVGSGLNSYSGTETMPYFVWANQGYFRDIVFVADEDATDNGSSGNESTDGVYEFKIEAFSDNEETFLLKNISTGRMEDSDGIFRFLDGIGSEIVYGVDLGEKAETGLLTLKIGQKYQKIEISIDGKNWNEVLNVSDNSGVHQRTYLLNQYVDDWAENDGRIWVRISSGDGYKGSFGTTFFNLSLKYSLADGGTYTEPTAITNWTDDGNGGSTDDGNGGSTDDGNGGSTDDGNGGSTGNGTVEAPETGASNKGMIFIAIIAIISLVAAALLLNKRIRIR